MNVAAKQALEEINSISKMTPVKNVVMSRVAQVSAGLIMYF